MTGGRSAVAIAIVAGIAVAAALWWWTRPVPAPPAAPLARLEPVGFEALAGWQADDLRPALAAFRTSCARLQRLPAERQLGRGGFAGSAADWHAACREAAAVAADDAAAARRFFETQFRPVAVRPAEGAGLFTGYYEPELRGSRQADETFGVPLHRRPPDLVSVDLAAFRDDLKGRIAGRVQGDRLVPYYSRGEIVDGALAGKSLELVWVDDPVDAFFLQIQGSGRVVLPDGSALRVGYDGQNGHPYYAVGRELLKRGAVAPAQMSMQAIRAWMAANPGEADALMRLNRSYVFFRERDEDGPVGAQGVVLTPGRSLAVDRDIYPMGLPVWIDTRYPAGGGPEGGQPLRRLMLAQDTGGAIKGAVRGDVFFGYGAPAAELAGRMREAGVWYVLLPRAVAVARDLSS